MKDIDHIKGLDKLNKRLAELSSGMEIKALRSAAAKASTVAKRNIQSSAPIGSRYHKTYKGRIVSPGFLKRSIVKRTKTSSGIVIVDIGVKKEAFYGVQFLERGTKRTSKHKGWFTNAFVNSENQMLRAFEDALSKFIDKAISK